MMTTRRFCVLQVIDVNGTVDAEENNPPNGFIPGQVRSTVTSLSAPVNAVSFVSHDRCGGLFSR